MPELLTPYRKALTKYAPRGKARELLDAAMVEVKSVTYRVSARWVAYRLLQKGLLKSKADFHQVENYMRRARLASWGEWSPFTFADETRETVRIAEMNGGSSSYDPEEMAEEKVLRLTSFYVDIPRWYYENHYVEIWFEARAMAGQFEKYTPHDIPLTACGGDPSIPLKANGARRLREWSEEIGKTSVVLYFGDFDTKGEQIPRSIATNLYQWCPGLQIHRVGLLEEHTADIDENPDQPGKYQWEALSDEAARDLIQTGLATVLNPEAATMAKAEEERIAAEARDFLADKLDDYLQR